MRYFRTKNGKIFENEKALHLHFLTKKEFDKFDGSNIKIGVASYVKNNHLYLKYLEHGRLEIKDIKIKQADTIEELIQVGDLVCFYYHDYPYCVEKDETDELHASFYEIEKGKDDITKIYTKQGDNYILVAKKEDGDWRVI